MDTLDEPQSGTMNYTNTYCESSSSQHYDSHSAAVLGVCGSIQEETKSVTRQEKNIYDISDVPGFSKKAKETKDKLFTKGR